MIENLPELLTICEYFISHLNFVYNCNFSVHALILNGKMELN